MPYLLFVLFVFTACSAPDIEWIERPSKVLLAGPLPEAPIIQPRRPRVEPPLTIASFNLEVFGPSKSSRPDLVAEVAAIITRYDLVAVQEIKDVSGGAAIVLDEAVRAADSNYRMVLSIRSGLQEDDRFSREQYAFFYDASKIAPTQDGLVYDDSVHDRFQREPFVARFLALGTTTEFVVVNVHTKPAAALEEIAALDAVVEWIEATFVGVAGTVVLGDFNASCSYASPEELDRLDIRGDDYVWMIPDEADTNVASTECAYDRIVTTFGLASAFTGDWGVDQGFDDPDVSDHWPVWTTFDPRAAPP